MTTGHRILLVDDEPGLREAVQAYLEEHGFLVTPAANPQQAFQLLSTVQPEVVISDIMMPGMDGFQFLHQLRQLELYSHLPVIFLTAKGMTADRIQGYRAGVDAYLPKPFDPDELVAIVQNQIDRAQTLAPPAVIARELASIRAMLTEKGDPEMVTSGQPSPPPPPTPPIQVDLTPREQEVLEKVAEGLMNKEIAKQLQTSIRNVEKYVTRLLNKTGTSSRTELVRYAITYGLIHL
ncbi:MAG: response regulator transcription factor [Cyanobacteriota bacterium]|nr:response regulator transcription factor [Cyanobacteriota bacterium]